MKLYVLEVTDPDGNREWESPTIWAENIRDALDGALAELPKGYTCGVVGIVLNNDPVDNEPWFMSKPLGTKVKLIQGSKLGKIVAAIWKPYQWEYTIDCDGDLHRGIWESMFDIIDESEESL